MRVVIVGAGLSGLTFASFLRRLNVDCVVLEQSPYLHAHYQVPITLYANALSCFKAFGLDCIFTHDGVAPEPCFGIMDERGRWLLRISNYEVRMRSLGAEDIVPLSTAPPANSESIVSQRLAEQAKLEMGRVPFRFTSSAERLRDGLRSSIPEIKFSSRVVDLAPHDGIKGGVHVVLQDGSTEWGDVVVGADGMHSTIRRLLYPDEHIGTSSNTLGMMQVDGYVDTPHCPTGLEYPVERWGRRRTVSLAPLFAHGQDRLAFSAVLYERPHELVSTSPTMSVDEVCDVYRAVLRRNFSDFGEELASLLGRANLALPSEVLEVPVMPRWFNRRAVLIGEAAHGSIASCLAQDASLCVEDAAILATALLDVPLSTDRGFEYAFNVYERVRRDRIERYIRQSRRARRMAATRHVTARNAFLRAVPSLSVRWGQRWLSQWTYSTQQLEVDAKIKMETAFR